MKDIILEAIKRANKLGAKGIRVIDYIEPKTATQSPYYTLITDKPEPQSASDTVWYEG